MIKTFYRGMLIVFFSIWFGGFTFYTSVVVPTGTVVLGSARTQGFITQQVTDWLNIVSWFAISMFVIELLVEFKSRSRSKNIFMVVLVGVIALFSGVLEYVHDLLDAHIVISENGVFENEVNDAPQFYQTHRVYLWVSTFQWIGCWIWLFVTMHGWTNDRIERAVK